MFSSPGPVALIIGPFSLRWYGILIAIAIAVGISIAHREARRRGEDPNQLLDILTPSIISAIVFARIYYVVFNLTYYSRNILKVFAVWEGGLAIHGGILGGIGMGIYLLKKRNLPIGKYLDITAPSLILGQSIGRWGNFFNQEAFGIPTNLPWKLYIAPGFRPPEYATFSFFHPTFLYESIWNFFVFVLLYFFLRLRIEKFNGALFLSYLGFYSAGRLFTESLRIDSLMLGPFRVAQLLSIGLILISVYGLYKLNIKFK